jgi:hypothetical protein
MKFTTIFLMAASATTVLGYGERCYYGSSTGTCGKTCSGGTTHTGRCPGGNDNTCCVPNPVAAPTSSSSGGQTTCRTNAGISGMCGLTTSQCRSAGKTYESGHCPNHPWNVKCCFDPPQRNPSHATGPTPTPRRNMLARAKEWVDVKLQYCWARNGGSNAAAGNKACAPICRRHSDRRYDAYRSDCSGLVSWAWGLPPPGQTTYTMRAGRDVQRIDCQDLKPGDAILNGHHTELFVQWENSAKSTATFYEEPGCSSSIPHAKATTASFQWNLGGTYPIRFGRSRYRCVKFARAGAYQIGYNDTFPKLPRTDTDCVTPQGNKGSCLAAGSTCAAPKETLTGYCDDVSECCIDTNSEDAEKLDRCQGNKQDGSVAHGFCTMKGEADCVNQEMDMTECGGEEQDFGCCLYYDGAYTEETEGSAGAASALAPSFALFAAALALVWA